METQYSKFEYLEAKKVIKGAEIVRCFSTTTHRDTTYQTADGQQWYEFESLLEAPEDDYSLTALPIGKPAALDAQS